MTQNKIILDRKMLIRFPISIGSNFMEVSSIYIALVSLLYVIKWLVLWFSGCYD